MVDEFYLVFFMCFMKIVFGIINGIENVKKYENFVNLILEFIEILRVFIFCYSKYVKNLLIYIVK